ncbi:MAG: T9SS type A sorting domain-containing protein, partial [Bacteroidia bacterium]|nr:T9SS type A sorting domain-containing protein [Bacteroidia bacterium]
RSFNAGSTWDSVGSPDALNNGTSSQAWYDLIAAVDPNNPDILIAGGISLVKSTDAGITWSTIMNSSNGHVDQHFLQFNGSTKLIVGNDGGIYYSENINAASPSFANKNNGYNVTQFYACDFHPTNTNYFLAGAQDNRTQKFTTAGINSTTVATSGDGGVCHIDQTDGMIQITSNTSNNFFRSTNGGTSFAFLGSVSNDRGQFINPSDYDNNANTLFSGDDPGKYYIVSGWEGTPVGNVANVFEMGSREVTAIKVDPFSTNTIWVGASFGTPSVLIPQVYKITDANYTTPTVIKTATLSAPAGAAISSIDIDPSNANHILVTLSNYGVTSVWQSTDGGSVFTDIEGDLPDMPVHWGIFAPANAQLSGAGGGNGGILLGTELGVWSTSQINGSSTQWIPNNSGLANVSTRMLKYRPSDNLVAAATHGRGLFTTILPTVVTGLPDNPVTKGFIKYISAENGQLQIVVGNLSVKDMTVQLYDMNGRMVDNRKNKYQNSVVNIQRLSTGSYIVKITGDKKENFVQQFIKR